MDITEDVDSVMTTLGTAFERLPDSPEWQWKKFEAIALFNKLIAERTYLRGTVVRQEQRIINLMESANAHQ